MFVRDFPKCKVTSFTKLTSDLFSRINTPKKIKTNDCIFFNLTGNGLFFFRIINKMFISFNCKTIKIVLVLDNIEKNDVKQRALFHRTFSVLFGFTPLPVTRLTANPDIRITSRDLGFHGTLFQQNPTWPLLVSHHFF